MAILAAARLNESWWFQLVPGRRFHLFMVLEQCLWTRSSHIQPNVRVQTYSVQLRRDRTLGQSLAGSQSPVLDVLLPVWLSVVPAERLG